MSMQGEIELTFGQFLDQKWFKRLTRVAVVLLSLFAGSALTYFFTLGKRVDAIEQDRTLRIQQNNQALADMGDDINKIKIDAASLRVDVGVVKGILLDMQRREDVASLARRFDSPQPIDPSLP